MHRDAARWQINEQQEVLLESGFDPTVRSELRNRGHQVLDFDHEQIFDMGGAQLIKKTPDGYIGGTDHRKDGIAAGF